MVRMCTGLVSLIRSIIAASVVDLPEPVGPTTSTMPYGLLSRFVQAAGAPSSSSVRTRKGTTRRASAEVAALTERVGTEATEAVHTEREVDLPVTTKFFELAVVEQRVHHAVDLVGRKHRHVLERDEHAVATSRGRATHREVEVGGT